MKIGLPGKSILGDYFQEKRTSRRHFLLLRISFPGRPIFIQFVPAEAATAVDSKVARISRRKEGPDDDDDSAGGGDGNFTPGGLEYVLEMLRILNDYTQYGL